MYNLVVLRNCQSLLGSIKCSTCQKLMTIDIEGKSYKCCHTIPYHPTIETLFDQLEEYLTSCNTNVNELFDFLKNTATLLYENHYLRVIAKRYLTQLLTNASKGSIVVGLQAARLARPNSDASSYVSGVLAWPLDIETVKRETAGK